MIHWNSLSEFFAMGRHGLYVWGSFIVMAASMVIEPLLIIRRRNRLVARIRRRHEANRRDRRSPGGDAP